MNVQINLTLQLTFRAFFLYEFLLFQTITSAFLASSLKLTKIDKCSVKILAAKLIASRGLIEPLVQTSKVNLSKSLRRPTRVLSTLVIYTTNWGIN